MMNPLRYLAEMLTSWPFLPISANPPPSSPQNPRNRRSWPRYYKAARRWGTNFERTVPPRTLTLTPVQNYTRTVPLLCPEHFTHPPINPGAVCPFDRWPEEPLP